MNLAHFSDGYTEEICWYVELHDEDVRMINEKENLMEPTCDTCSHCSYVHEYDIYLCRVTDDRIELHDDACCLYEEMNYEP